MRAIGLILAVFCPFIVTAAPACPAGVAVAHFRAEVRRGDADLAVPLERVNALRKGDIVTFVPSDGAAGVERLNAVVGPAWTAEILYSARRLTSAEALQIGLVNRVVPEAELEAATTALARQIAAKSPLTLAIGKEAFYRQAEMDLASAYGYASDVMARNMMARDAGIGIDALLSRTRPEWCGR